MNLSGRLAALLAVVVLIVVALVGWFALISPERSKAADLRTQLDTTRANLASTQAYVNDPKNKAKVAELQRLQALVPDQLKMSQVLRQLVDASAASGVKVTTITPGTAVPVSGGTATPVTLNVAGHYFNLARFFRLLEARAQLTNDTVSGKGLLYSADNLTFSGGGAAAAGTEGSGTVLSASLTLSVYSYTGAAAPTTTTSTDATTTTSDASP